MSCQSDFLYLQKNLMLTLIKRKMNSVWNMRLDKKMRDMLSAYGTTNSEKGFSLV